MNADIIKRERIREALAARLLQLSKQCEDICTPKPLTLDDGFTRAKSTPESYKVGVFKLSFSEQAENASSSGPQHPSSDGRKPENPVIKSDTILPVMINNFVTPSLTALSIHEPKKDRAFSKDILNKNSATENRTESLSAKSDTHRDVDISADLLSECESHLFVTTPSTDLDRYMNQSDTSFHTDRSLSSPSDVTSVSEPDHVTVVSLTSDTESQDSTKLYEDYANLQSQNAIFSSVTSMSETQPKVLNDLPICERTCDIEPNSAALSSTTTKTARRRRLSYTLETASPVLEKALRNSSIGPETSKQISVSKTTKENINIHSQMKPTYCSKTADSGLPNLSFLDRPSSTRASFSSKSRIPIMNSPRPNASSVLSGYDHVSVLDRKNKSFRQLLDKINSSLAPLSSPKHDPNNSSRTESSISPPSTPVATRNPTLSTELQFLRDEIEQQRQLLSQQSKHLEEITQKQESFFQRLLSAQHQQMSQLQKELSREVHELFAQHSLAVQTKLQNLEACIIGMTEDRPRISVDNSIDGNDEADVVGESSDILPDNQAVFYNDVTEVLPEQLVQTNDQSIVQYSQPSKPYANINFDIISAAVKGYLTRRLLKTEKVQGLIQTIKDTMECALNLHEVARNNIAITKDDAELHQRLINQVTSACHAFHDVFFQYSVQERMNLIAQSRQLAKEKTFQVTHRTSRPYISSATIKSLERKKFAKSKSVSPNTGRMRWKEPKRASTAVEVQKKANSPIHRSVTPVGAPPNRSKKYRGDGRSPSFYM